MTVSISDTMANFLLELNVLISKTGVGQLCDFGLSRLIQARSGSGMTTTTAHTGTIRYLARELVVCRTRAIPTKATDIYALGCLALVVCQLIPHHLPK
jgi:serine/threonine protein kinase